MKTSENAAIVVLIVSALVLTGLLVTLFQGTGQKAYADASSRAGKYIMVSAAADKDIELLYVVDVERQQMNVYRTDTRRARRIVLGDRVDLKRLFTRR